jgi:hypothetical protein
MKCNIPKRKKMTEREYNRMVEALTQVRCCKCGYTIEVMSFAYATMNFNKKRYENRLCDKCKKESEDTE